MSLRGFFMRSWRWAQNEWRRRWKLTEYILILILVQTAVLLCFLSPSRFDKGETLAKEHQRRIGQYIVLFTTASPGALSLKEQGDDYLGVKDGHLEKKIIADIEHSETLNDDHIYTNISGNEHSRSDELDIYLKLASDGHVQKIDHIINDKEEEDPDVGRGFVDEYVTHLSDGKGVLLIDEVMNKTDKSIKASNDKFIPGVDTMGNIKYQVEPDTGLSSTAKAYQTFIPNRKTNSGSLMPKNVTKSVNIRKYTFRNYNVSDPPDFILKNSDQIYFMDVGNNRTCFIQGTDIKKTKRTKGKSCLCLKYYYGTDCGIPEAAWFGRYVNLYPDTKLKRRSVPRRVINGLPVNHEFAMFEARMHELYDSVDVFLVAESNYTSYGKPKELQFLRKFQEGYLSNFQDKLVYINLAFFPNESKSNGWIADSYIRFYMGIKGLRRLKGLRDDDLFVLSDADELPTKEIITFLKLYDGYPEPVGFGMRWNVFSFHWQVPPDPTFMNWFSGAAEKLTIVYSAATVGLVQKVLYKNVFFIRKEKAWEHEKLADMLKKYREEGHMVKDWVAGTIGHYAGWHCSWCFSPANIVRKMDSAQANDKPRWGDYPEKKNLTYLTNRIWQGKWFDDETQFLPVKNSRDRFYAPPYFMEHPQDYRSILFHPSHPRNKDQEWKPP